MRNNLYTINLSMNAKISLGTTEIDSILYNTKITKQKSIFSTIQITPVTTNVTTQVSLARNMISAFTINSSNIINQSHHNIMVAVLLGIFMCITLSITISIFVFCRKKNSVFMLQKCEQDSDLEMTDMNTEVDTSDSEYEFIESSTPTSTRRSLTCPDLHVYQSENMIAEESHMQQEQHSKNRHSNTRNKFDLQESPTSTPLLNQSDKTLKQTGSTSLSVEMYSKRTLPGHSLSLDYVTELSGANERKRHKEKKKFEKDKLGKNVEVLKTFEMQVEQNRTVKEPSKKSSSTIKVERNSATIPHQASHSNKSPKNSKTASDINETKKATGNSDSVVKASNDFRTLTDFSIFDTSLRTDKSDNKDMVLADHSELLLDDTDEDKLDKMTATLENV